MYVYVKSEIDNPVLYHWELGSKVPGSKYISRIKEKGKWVYTYASNTANKVKTAVKNVTNKNTSLKSQDVKKINKYTYSTTKEISPGHYQTNYIIDTYSRTKDNAKAFYDLLGPFGTLRYKEFELLYDAFTAKGQKEMQRLIAELESEINNTDGSRKTKKGTSYKYKYRVTIDGKYRYFYDEKSYERWKERQKYQNNEPQYLKDVKETDVIDDTGNVYVPTAKQDLENTNKENYELYTHTKSYNDYLDYHTNCFRTTVAYEMRERGYDVEANEAREDDQYVSNMYDIYKNPDIKCVVAPDSNAKPVTNVKKGEDGKKHTYYDGGVKADNIFKPINTDSHITSSQINTLTYNLSKEPNSRGSINVYWSEVGSGHAMSYKVDNNGKATLIDPQSGTIFDWDELKDAYVFWYFRTDNLALNEECLDYVREK